MVNRKLLIRVVFVIIASVFWGSFFRSNARQAFASDHRGSQQLKEKFVTEIIEDLSNYNTIGLIEMESIGAGTVQKLRAELRGKAKIKVAKNTLIKKALEMVENLSGAENLSERIEGPVALLFTDDSPYKIANYLEKNKVPAKAKAGQISPKSVTVKKQNTGEPPGTIISELNSVGLPTRI